MSEPEGRTVSPTPLLIRDLPLDERPRHRLLQNGSQSLSDAELICGTVGLVPRPSTSPERSSGATGALEASRG